MATTKYRDARAVCLDCSMKWDDYKKSIDVRQNAASHAKRSGHKVKVEIVKNTVYNDNK